MVNDPFQNARIFLNVLTSLGVSPQKAIGALGSISGESGFRLDSSALNPGDGSDGSNSVGWGQWNGIRAKNLKATADALGVPISDPRAQALHIRNELTGQYKQGNYSGVLKALLEAPDTVDAGSDIWTRQYEAPKNPNVAERTARGLQLARAMAGDSGNIDITDEARSLSGATLKGPIPSVPSEPTTRGIKPLGFGTPMIADATSPKWYQDVSGQKPKQPSWMQQSTLPADNGNAPDSDFMKQWGIAPTAQVTSGDTTTAANDPNNPDSLLQQWGIKPSTMTKSPASPDAVSPTDQAWWQGHEGHGGVEPVTGKPIDTLADKAAQVGVGAVRGGKDVLDSAAHGLLNVVDEGLNPSNPGGAPVFDPLALIGSTGIGNLFHGYAEGVKADDAAARAAYEAEATKAANPLYGEGGRLGGQIAGTLAVTPMGRVAGAADAVTGAAPTVVNGITEAAPLANRLASSVLGGAGGGGLFNLATSSARDNPTLQQMGEGALGGAALGPLGMAAGAVGNAVGNRLLGGSVSPAVARLAQAAQRLGIDLRGSQVSNSPFLKATDDVVRQTPLTGSWGKDARGVYDQFGRAVSRTFGEDTPNITPDVIERASTRLGQGFQQIAARNTLTVDNQFANDLGATVADARQTLTPDQFHPFENLLNNVISKINHNGQIDGNVYSQLTRKGSPIDVLQHSPDTAIRNAANSFRNNLDDLFERSAQPGDVDSLRALRRQWKSMRTVEDIVEKNPTGEVNPLLLMQKVVNSPGGKANAGDLGTLADIGKQFFSKYPDSGTALRNVLWSAVKNPMQIPAAGLQLGIGSLPANLANMAMLSRDWFRNGIIQRSLTRGPVGPVNRLIQGSVPYVQQALPPSANPGRIESAQ